MDQIAKDVPFWGELLPPKLSSSPIIDLIEPLLEQSDCVVCECSSFHCSNVFIYNLKSNLNNNTVKEYSDSKCNHCLHTLNHHINTKVFAKHDRLVQEAVLKRDLNILQTISNNESQEIQIILEDVIDAYHRLLTRKNIPAQLIDSSNDTPAEIPSIEFVSILSLSFMISIFLIFLSHLDLQ